MVAVLWSIACRKTTVAMKAPRVLHIPANYSGLIPGLPYNIIAGNFREYKNVYGFR